MNQNLSQYGLQNASQIINPKSENGTELITLLLAQRHRYSKHTLFLSKIQPQLVATNESPLHVHVSHEQNSDTKISQFRASFSLCFLLLLLLLYSLSILQRHICFALLFLSNPFPFFNNIISQISHTLSLNEISLINFSLTFTVSATKFFFSQMASLQLLKPTFTSISTSHPGKSSWVFRESDSRKRVLRFASSISRNSRYYYTNRSFRVCCEGRDTDNQSNNGKLLYTYSSSFSCFLRFL